MSFDIDAFNNDVFGFEQSESNPEKPKAIPQLPPLPEIINEPEAPQTENFSMSPNKNQPENFDGVDKYYILKNIMKEKDRKFYLFARETEEPYLFVTNQVDQVLAGHASYSQYPVEQISIPKSVTIFFMNVEHSYFGGIVKKIGPSMSKDFFPEFVQRELELPNEIHLIRAFPIKWETRKFLGFHKVKDIRNPLNRNLETGEPQRINMAHECQEVAESAAMELKRAYDEWSVDEPPIYRPRPRFPMMGRGMMDMMGGGHPMYPSMFPTQNNIFPGQMPQNMHGGMGPGFPMGMMGGHAGGNWPMHGQQGEFGQYGGFPGQSIEAPRPMDQQEQFRRTAIQVFNKRSMEVQNTSGGNSERRSRPADGIEPWDSQGKDERTHTKLGTPEGANGSNNSARGGSGHGSKHSRFSSKDSPRKSREERRRSRRTSSSESSNRSSKKRHRGHKSRRNRSYSSSRSSPSSRSRSRDRHGHHRKRH